jgi:hypothetical protein
MQEKPHGQQISEDTTRYIINERFYIDRDKRPGLGVESFHFGVFSPTGEIVQLGDGRVGHVVNYLGGGDTLDDALTIVKEAAARYSQAQQSLF